MPAHPKSAKSGRAATQYSSAGKYDALAAAIK
jgi:hypothetical protein